MMKQKNTIITINYKNKTTVLATSVEKWRNDQKKRIRNRCKRTLVLAQKTTVGVNVVWFYAASFFVMPFRKILNALSNVFLR